MTDNCLQIAWDTGDEYINLDELQKMEVAKNDEPAANFYTFEDRADGRTCVYKPLLIDKKVDHTGSIVAFSLKYDDKGRLEDGEIAHVESGTADCVFENDRWHCKWRVDSGEKTRKPTCKLQLCDSQRKFRMARQMIRQAGFRKMIIHADDGMCVITGESQLQALDAAHVHEVRSDGDDEIYNGITLRKDLHALFDLRLFTITPDGNLETTDHLTENYAKLLMGKKLPSKTLQRVRASLEKRRKCSE